jgi:cytochrome-b5 reductase
MLPDGPDDKPKAMVRPYTPTSSCDAKGYMDLVVKVYPNGKLSKHIGSLEVGDTLDVKVSCAC